MSVAEEKQQANVTKESELAAKLFDSISDFDNGWQDTFAQIVEEAVAAAGKHKTSLNWDYICYEYCPQYSYGRSLMFQLIELSPKLKKNCYTAVHSLLKTGCNPNAILNHHEKHHLPNSCMYWTPLLYCIDKEWWEMVELLMTKFKADQNLIHKRKAYGDINYGPMLFYPIHYLLSFQLLTRQGVYVHNIKEAESDKIDGKLLKNLKILLNDENKKNVIEFDWNNLINFEFCDRLPGDLKKTTILKNTMGNEKYNFELKQVRNYLFSIQKIRNYKIKMNISNYMLLESTNAIKFFEKDSNLEMIDINSQYDKETILKMKRIINSINYRNTKYQVEGLNTASMTEYIEKLDEKLKSKEIDCDREYLIAYWFKIVLRAKRKERVVQFLLPKTV